MKGKKILEVKHNGSVDLYFYKGGFLRKNRYQSINDIDHKEISSQDIILVIPDTLLITKTINLPIDYNKNFNSLLLIKSALIKNIAFNLNELYNNYFIINNKLYFIGVKKESINNYLDFFKKLKVNVINVINKSYILKIIFNLNNYKSLGINFEDDYLSIFSFDDNGYLLFSVLPYGAQSFINLREEVLITRIVNELFRIISSFQSQNKINIERLLLFTDNNYQELPVLSYLSKSFPGISFITKDEDKYLDIYAKLLETKKEFPINLSIDQISKDYQKEQNLNQIDNLLTIGSVTSLFVIILITMFYNNNIKREDMILQGLINNYDSQRNSLSSNNNYSLNIKNDFILYRLISDLNNNTNNNIFLENLYLKDQNIHLTLVSKDYSSLIKVNNSIKDFGFKVSMEQVSKFNVLENIDTKENIDNKFYRLNLKVEQ